MNKFIVLGSTQDGGYPQSGCKDICCKNVIPHQRLIASCSIIDTTQQQFWLIDATPDIKNQLILLNQYIKKCKHPFGGIFLTHAHVGHYIGLLELGLEIMNLKNIPVYAMPKMCNFLRKNEPFHSLINREN